MAPCNEDEWPWRQRAGAIEVALAAGAAILQSIIAAATLLGSSLEDATNGGSVPSSGCPRIWPGTVPGYNLNTLRKKRLQS